MKKIIFIIPLLLLTMFISSCDDEMNSITQPIDLVIADYDNTPVVVNVENSYTFTINANNFDYISEKALNFDSDSVVVTITLQNASSTNSKATVYDTNDNPIFEESLNENKVIVEKDLIKSIPGRIKIELTDFTGQLTVVIAVEQ